MTLPDIHIDYDFYKLDSLDRVRTSGRGMYDFEIVQSVKVLVADKFRGCYHFEAQAAEMTVGKEDCRLDKNRYHD